MRSAGRPSVAGQRRQEILDAFVELVAERGLDGVSLQLVADRAGVARTAVRHFVGNRSDLVRAGAEAVVDRYERTLRAAVGDEPGAAQLVEFLFDDRWIRGDGTADRAVEALLLDAARSAEARTVVRELYERLHAEVRAALARSRPGAANDDLDAAAYAIVCLSEQNATLQAIGFDPSLSDGSKAVAHRLVDLIGER